MQLKAQKRPCSIVTVQVRNLTPGIRRRLQCLLLFHLGIQTETHYKATALKE